MIVYNHAENIRRHISSLFPDSEVTTEIMLDKSGFTVHIDDYEVDFYDYEVALGYSDAFVRDKLAAAEIPLC